MALDPADREHVPDDRHTELAQSACATAPSATRPSPARSSARSRVRVVESCFSIPVRSAWPGRGTVRTGWRSCGITLRFSITMPTGAPEVAPFHTPPTISTRSRSIFARAPHRPGVARVAVDGSRRERHSAGIPSRIPRTGAVVRPPSGRAVGGRHPHLRRDLARDRPEVVVLGTPRPPGPARRGARAEARLVDQVASRSACGRRRPRGARKEVRRRVVQVDGQRTGTASLVGRVAVHQADRARSAWR